jgi:hypothetical protein
MKYDDGFLRTVGLVTVDFSAVETETATLAWWMLPTSLIGSIITAELSLRGLRNLVLALFRHRNPPEAEVAELQALMKRVEAAEIQRNRIVHSLWVPVDTGLLRHKLSAKGQLNITFEAVAPAQLEQFATELDALISSIVAFRSKYLHATWA